jgi:hypothetical protein
MQILRMAYRPKQGMDVRPASSQRMGSQPFVPAVQINYGDRASPACIMSLHPSDLESRR